MARTERVWTPADKVSAAVRNGGQSGHQHKADVFSVADAGQNIFSRESGQERGWENQQRLGMAQAVAAHSLKRIQHNRK
jgi:hypothetical protein